MSMIVFCALLVSLVSQPLQPSATILDTSLGVITGVVKQEYESVYGEFVGELCGAEVCITNSNGDFLQGTYTDTEGTYLFWIPPGVYTIVFKMCGFATVTVENVEVVGLPFQVVKKDIWKLTTRINAAMIPQAQHSYIHVTPQE